MARWEDIADALRESVARGDYPPGSLIPKETELMRPGGIYDRLEDAGHGPIRWSEAITARMPSAEEGRLLPLPPGVPLLRIVRLTASKDGRPLEVNDTRLDAERFEVGYPIARHDSARWPRAE